MEHKGTINLGTFKRQIIAEIESDRGLKSYTYDWPKSAIIIGCGGRTGMSHEQSVQSAWQARGKLCSSTNEATRQLQEKSPALH